MLRAKAVILTSHTQSSHWSQSSCLFYMFFTTKKIQTHNEWNMQSLNSHYPKCHLAAVYSTMLEILIQIFKLIKFKCFFMTIPYIWKNLVILRKKQLLLRNILDNAPLPCAILPTTQIKEIRCCIYHHV